MYDIAPWCLMYTDASRFDMRDTNRKLCRVNRYEFKQLDRINSAQNKVHLSFSR